MGSNNFRRSFRVCGITSSSAADIRPAEMLEGQLCSDSEDELENPFNDDEVTMCKQIEV